MFLEAKQIERADLELLVAIRRHGHLAAAARSLQISPPGVSKRLAALERRLGLALFQRSTRRVHATGEGEWLCEQAEELLQAWAGLEDRVRERLQEPAGRLRLVSTFGFGRRWLGPALADFQRLHPAVQIELQLTEHLPDLAAEGLDGAIWLWNAPPSRGGDWVTRTLARNRRVVVAAPAYLQAHGAPDTPQALRSHRCLVVRENGGRAGQPRFDHWRLQHDDDPKPLHVRVDGPLSSNSGEMVRDWCLAGEGLMLRSLWDVAPHLAAGTLVRVLPGWSMPDADVHWLAPHRPQVPRRVRLLVDALAERFAAEPWKLNAPAAPPG